MIRTIIVDDEPLAIEILETHCASISDLEVVSTFGNAVDASTYLSQNTVDLMLLDIQMPQLTGLDFLRNLNNPPQVIFTTAYSEYAVDGFELNAIDYLLKPISFDRFLKAINKYRSQLGATSAVSAEEEEDHIFVKADKKLIKVNYDEVLYIEGLKDYVIIRMGDKRVITLQTMKSLDQKLPDSIFMRIHRSYIINVSKIEALVGNMVEITEKGEKKHIPVGKNYRETLLELINDRKI